MMPQPRWPMDRLVIPEPNPLATTGPVWIPLRSKAALIRDVLAAGVAPMPLQREVLRRHAQAGATASGDVALPRRIARGDARRGTLWRPRKMLRALEKLIGPGCLRRARTAPDGTRRDPWPAAPFSKAQKAHLPLAAMEHNSRLDRRGASHGGVAIAVDRSSAAGAWNLDRQPARAQKRRGIAAV